MKKALILILILALLVAMLFAVSGCNKSGEASFFSKAKTATLAKPSLPVVQGGPTVKGVANITQNKS